MRGRKIECIRFADDMVTFGENEEEEQNMFEDLNYKYVQYGMRINKKKHNVW